MAVLITDMEMPTSCWRCPLCLTVDPDTYRCIPTGQEFESTFDAIDHIVCDCPLVHVPPHGRLIDADVLKEVSHYDDYDMCVVDVDDIDNAPTVIPADESDMDSFIHILKEDDEEDGMDSFIRILKD